MNSVPFVGVGTSATKVGEFHTGRRPPVRPDKRFGWCRDNGFAGDSDICSEVVRSFPLEEQAQTNKFPKLQ